MLNGRNPDTSKILELIHLDKYDIERFRDCGLNKEKKFIWVLTRTGGPNRVAFPNNNIILNPYYTNNHDESFDNTFAIYYFEIPLEADISLFQHSDIPNLKWLLDRNIEEIESVNVDNETKEFMEMFGLPPRRAFGK